MSFQSSGAVQKRNFNLLIASATSAPAGSFIEYFGQTLLPGGVPSGAALAARNSFLSNVTLPGVESFEGKATGGTMPNTASFTGSVPLITAALSVIDNSALVIVKAVPITGRFNTTNAGAKYFDIMQNVFVTFSQPVKAFGLYLTDMGDFESANPPLKVTIFDSLSGSATFTPAALPTRDGNLIFWGFTDSRGLTYTEIRIENNFALPIVGDEDFFGIDDLIVGTPIA